MHLLFLHHFVYMIYRSSNFGLDAELHVRSALLFKYTQKERCYYNNNHVSF